MFTTDTLQPGQNPVITGGLLLMILGAAWYALRRIRTTIGEFIERFLVVKLEVLDEDEAYHWMQLWLADRLQKTLSISVVTRRTRLHCNDEDEAVDPHRHKPAIYFVPAVGTYFFWYKGRFVTLHRERQENSSSQALSGVMNVSGKSQLRDKESFTLRIISRNRDLARQLIEECRDMALPVDGKLDIRTPSYGCCWSLSTRITPRPLHTVILDGNQADDLLADMKEFLACRDWYHDIGVPYRRGYLMHGPPGNGKTSVVKALAGELGMNVYLLMLNDSEINDNRVNELLAKVPERNILLLEDIDCAFTKRKRTSGKEGGLTFSGLLNAIDGVASAEGRIIVMTTNHIDRLDPALIRPGRADVKMLFGNATRDQAGRLFARFFPRHVQLAGEFADKIDERRFSMATLQDYFMLHRRNPDDALGRLYEIHALEHCSVTQRPLQVHGASRRHGVNGGRSNGRA